MKRIMIFTLVIFIFSLNLFANVSITGTINRNLRILYLYNLRDLASFNTRLFSVTFTNNADTAVNIHLLISLSSQRYGEVSVMTTNQFMLNPLETWTLVNTSLNNNGKNITINEIQINSDIEELINETVAAGRLPEDVYTLSVHVLGPDNTELAQWSENFNVINSIIITPIFPGGTNVRNIQTVNSSNLRFIWNSRTDMAFNFYLYKYSRGSVSGINVLSSPIYEKDDINEKSLQYPPDAPPLEKGRIYIWQVSSYIITSNGGQQVKSEPSFFRYMGSAEVGNDLLIGEIKRVAGRGAISKNCKVTDAKLNGKEISLLNLLYILKRINKNQVKGIEVVK
ncbi:MAG: hypothetical protein GWP03_02100 [Proteobacteria bacterium]|nr:hypothetical protein [Pseudomonadota bacterium]